MKSFLGLVGYYRHFVEGFSKIARPLHNLTRKRVSFFLDDKCEQSFQELKRRLTLAVVLTFLDENEGFVVLTYASY